MRNRWWDARSSTISPSSLVNHLWLFINRLGERFDSRHGVLGIKVINRRFDNSRRHEHRILFTLPHNLRVLFVVLPDLVNLLRVLYNHNDPLIIEMIGRGRSGDSSRDIEPIDLHQLLHRHDMNLYVLVLPSEDLLLFVGIVGNVLEDLVVLRLDCLEPSYEVLVLLLGFADVLDYLAFVLVFFDGEARETGIEQIC